jgi:hypothetical protein
MLSVHRILLPIDFSGAALGPRHGTNLANTSVLKWSCCMSWPLSSVAQQSPV